MQFVEIVEPMPRIVAPYHGVGIREELQERTVVAQNLVIR